MRHPFGRVEEFQVSGLEWFDGQDWRRGLRYFVNGMRRRNDSVTYRPKVLFSTPARVSGLPSRSVDLRFNSRRTGYFAYGDSDRNDDVLIAKADLPRMGLDMIVDGQAPSGVLTALHVLAESRGANAVAIRLDRLVGDGASFHLWTDGRFLHAAAVGVLVGLPDACDLARVRSNRPHLAAA
jgi:hypothetical protein